MENVKPISLDMLLGVTSRTGVARSGGRSQAGGLSEADGQEKQFVLPDDEAADAVAGPKTSAGQSQTNRPDARTRSRDPLGAGRNDQAVNPLAAASRPEPAQAALVTITQGTVNPPGILKMAGAGQQAGRGANGPTGIAAWWQSAQGANQPAAGQMQAMDRPAEGTAAAWMQGQGSASAVTGQSRQSAGQVPAAMAPGAKTTGGQPARNDIAPPTSRTPAQPGVTATAGAATATTGPTAAGPAIVAVPGAAKAANQVVPAGAEARPASPSVLPAAAPDETAQTEPPSQARGHGAKPQSLSGMAQQGVVSAVGEKSSAEVDPNLQAQARLIDRPEHTAKARSASLLEAARPIEAHATGQTSFLAGSQHVDSAAQAVPHGTQGPGEQRIAEASRPADQIIENVRHAIVNGQREVTINLNPPELGRVRLRMYSEGNEIHGRLEVDNPRTLTEIRHQAELLIQRLAEDGIAIRRLEVHQMSNNGGQTGSFSPQHQDSAGQMPWSHTRTTPAEQQRDRESADAAEAAAGARAAASAGAGQPLSAGGLNVWM